MTHAFFRATPALEGVDIEALAASARANATQVQFLNTTDRCYELVGCAWWWEVVDGELWCCADVQPRIIGMAGSGWSINHAALALRIDTTRGDGTATGICSVVLCKLDEGAYAPRMRELPPGEELGIWRWIRSQAMRMEAVKRYARDARGAALNDAETHELPKEFARPFARDLAWLAGEGQPHAMAWARYWASC